MKRPHISDRLYFCDPFLENILPTFNEISETYAARIREALRRDSFTANSNLTASVVRYSQTTAELKAIASEIKTWQRDNKPLTDSEQEDILRGTAEHLNLPDSRVLPRMVKNASNDAYMELVNDIGTILRPKGPK